MSRLLLTLVISFLTLSSTEALGQGKEDQLGAWYMYFWNTTVKTSPWGVQGDVQYRNWNLVGDMEQLLLRGGATYQPRGVSIKFTAGYAYVRSGEFGDGDATSQESRLYQEALLPQKLGSRVYLVHRFRFEQRFVEGQDFRTRWRYNLFITVPLNRVDLKPGAIYLAFYNEIFVNGQRNVGNGNRVELFDRNRTYGAVGYSARKGLRVQAGVMQQTTDGWQKEQAQVSLHHTF